MYSKIIDLYFSTAGEQLTRTGESAETLDPLEIMAGETFLLLAQVIHTEIVDGVLNVHPVAMSQDSRPELRGIAACDGRIMFASAGEISEGRMIFTVNTATETFRQAANDMDQEYFLVIADTAFSHRSPCQLGRIPFRAAAQCDWSLTPPGSRPPEFLSRSAVTALWKQDMEMLFSSDLKEWHRDFTAGDIYFRICRQDGGSGPALPVPSCTRLTADAFGTEDERPPADSGCRIYLNDTTGMLSCSNGTSWSNSFPLTGPQGTSGSSVAAAPVFFPCSITEDGRTGAELNSGSPETVFLLPVPLPAVMTFNWTPPAAAGSWVIQILGDGNILAEATVDAATGIHTVPLQGSGRTRITLRRMTEKNGDTCPETLFITGASFKYTVQ